MTDHQNFKNGDNHFNIFLNDNGDLEFNANGESPAGDTRMVISNLACQVTIGGSGRFGQVQLRSDIGENTLFLGGDGEETNAILGGGGQAAHVQLNDSSHRRTVDLQAERGLVQLLNSAGTVTVFISGEDGSLALGGSGEDGDLLILNSAGTTTIRFDGDSGLVTSNGFSQLSDGRLKTDIAPIAGALSDVLTLRGVRYRRKGGAMAAAAAIATDAPPEIGFVGQEVEEVCPELVSTDSEGFKSVSYSRMTAILVEAIKEQQQIIREQAAALADVLRRLSAVEAGLEANR